MSFEQRNGQKRENESKFLGGRVSVVVGDITSQAVDAVVNAANSSLLGGGGVDGAIHRAGGPAILEQCREIRRTRHPNGLPAGKAEITNGGNMPARYVIHTVGPVYGQHGGQESKLLAECYENSLMLAASHALTSIAFPAISTGVYGYPQSEAAAVASRAIKQHIEANKLMREVRLVFFKESDKEVFLKNQEFE